MDENEIEIIKDGFKNKVNFEKVAKRINDYRLQKSNRKYIVAQSAGGIPFRYYQLGLISKNRAQGDYETFKKIRNNKRAKDRANSNDKSWYKQRNMALERDGNKCAICESEDKLHVHHIIAFKDSKSHEIKNLITLCEQCHKIVGKNKLWNSAFWVNYNSNKIFKTIVVKYLRIVSEMGYEFAIGKGISKYNGSFMVWKVAEKGTLDLKSDVKLKKKTGKEK